MNTETDYIVYTDGGCRINPDGPGGYAAVIINKQNRPIYITGYEPSTTNQRMELKAVITGLRMIERSSNIKVYSDSAYIINCFNQKWYEKWEKNKWINSKKEPVANIDLWIILLKLVRFHKNVEFIKVKGHSDNLINNKCDQLATDIVNFVDELNKL